jgi:hypothetical protein
MLELLSAHLIVRCEFARWLLPARAQNMHVMLCKNIEHLSVSLDTNTKRYLYHNLIFFHSFAFLTASNTYLVELLIEGVSYWSQKYRGFLTSLITSIDVFSMPQSPFNNKKMKYLPSVTYFLG